MMIAMCKRCIAVLIVVSFFSFGAFADVTVQTFLDGNNNGIRDEGENLVTGLLVEAVDASGNSLPFFDDGNGTFTLPSLLISSRLRVKVTGYGPGVLQGVAGPSSVFFAVDGDVIVVPVSAGPNFDPLQSRILVPCYEGGPAEGRTGPAFVSFPYGVNGIAEAKGGDQPNPNADATIEELGSTWGVAYQQLQQRAFTSALLKRHVGIGPAGIGGLYTIDYSNGTPEVNAVTLQGVVPSVGPAINLGNVLRETVSGDVDETMPYALTTADNVATYDMDAFAKVGAAGFGDIDLTEDERTLWMVNLNQRSLIAFDVSEEGPVNPSTSTVKHYPITSLPGLPNLNFRYAMCINAGGNLNGTGAEPFTDANQIAWDKNKYGTGGSSGYRVFTVENLLNPTAQTSESPLYHTFKRGDFSYDIPIPAEETYTVTLHFADPNQAHVVGDRLFDIMAEGQKVAENFDVVAAAGGTRTATTFTFQVPGQGEKLNLQFISKQGNRVKEAIVSGIEVVGESVMESGVLRPWGLNFHNGRGYLGLVSDATVSKSREHLFGYVVSFDPNNVEAGFTEELAFPLAYPRERASNAHLTSPQPLRSAEWQAWVNDWESTAILTQEEQLSSSNALLCAYPQPVLSDIDFTDDGGIVVGLMDRWAHQTGYRNYPSILGDQTLVVSYGAGDLLRVFNDQGIFRLESQNFDDGRYFREDDGPSFDGEFFYDDHFVASSAHHGEIFTGGLGVLPGSGEVVNTVFNPLLAIGNSNYLNQGVYTQGLHMYNTQNGAKERAYLFVDQFISGKANGLGDMEFASALVGGEMGNYVWCDANGNGIQDPQEFGIDGIILTLHDKENSGALVQTVVTENGGEFVFTDLLPNHCYSIRIDLSQLEAMGFSGEVPPAMVGSDTLVDSDGDPEMIPGFSVAMVCTGDIGTNDHSIDFGFLGPVADDCILVACDDGMGMEPCADFTLAAIAGCVDPTGGNEVSYFAILENDSLINEITTGPVRVCGLDSCIYARVSIPGDTMCFSIAKVTLSIFDMDAGGPAYERLICEDAMVNLSEELTNFGFDYDAGSEEFFSDPDKTMMITSPDMYDVGAGGTIYWSANLTGAANCMVMGSITYTVFDPSVVDMVDSITICGLECVDLTSIGAVFMSNNSGASLAEWTTSGGGSFVDDQTFAGARLYCPDSADLQAGQVVLTLTVMDDPCGQPEDSVVVTIESSAPRLIPSAPDTIDCIHPFVEDQVMYDTFPGCRLVVNCVDTLEGEVIDYQVMLGDCEDIVKQYKRTFRFRYDKQEYFCMDTIFVRGLPDTLICPPERDTVYCHTGYLLDENGHPSPYETGIPMADSIPLWPQPNKACDILVTYKDIEFGGECPETIRREWFIKNGCTGSFDTCVQWLMIMDTVPPTIMVEDTLVVGLTKMHDCFAEIYAPPVEVYDTCSGVKMVKARILNYGAVVMEYNPETGLFESHEKIKVPVSEIVELPDGIGVMGYNIIYEALDSCHNDTIAESFLVVVDRTRPVAVCDKGVNVTVSDSTVWVDATVFDEGTWDNCDYTLLLARRTDWYNSCGVDLCDSIVPVCTTEHHDTVWCGMLESDKKVNPIEAHYAKEIEWLCEDGSACSSLLLAGWAYDLMKYATLQCKDHPYPVDNAYFKELLADCDLEDIFSLIACEKSGYDTDGVNASFDFFKLIFDRYFTDENFGGDPFEVSSFVNDIGAQLGGGWSTSVPFCCEDACQEVTVEVLAMDYWCNWSKCWTTVRVEDKTPPKVVCELYDVSVTCASYKTYYEDAVNMALAGDYDSIQSVLGTYDKVEFDQYDNVAPKTTFDLYEISCDSSLVTKDSLFYDEHLGYVWKEYSYYRAEYDTLVSTRYNGQVADNCGLICIEEKPWVEIDHCGNGYVKRVFKFVGQCSIEGSGHVADTITRTQTIWITSDCEITPAMFEVPKDTIIYTCGIEYDPDGSGNVAGEGSPAHTGMARYTFDNDCRIVGIGYYDKVFKVVGGDEACYKIVRTWCFADWCDLGETPIEEAWWFNPRYEGKYLSYEQKIIMLDSTPPICTIDSIPPVIETAGCTYDLQTSVSVEDECGVLRYAWQVIDTKTLDIKGSGDGDLNSDVEDAFDLTVEGLITGSYLLKVLVTDECQNESVCEAPFVVDISKKPAPVCLSSITVELTPMDSDNDGLVDTAMAVIDADQFNVSSTAPCGSSSSQLRYRIDRGEGEPALPPSSATSLALGCADVGQHQVRMYVLDQVSGNWDFCQVILIVQNNMGGCDGASTAQGLLFGKVETELGTPVELVKIKLEDQAGNLLNEMIDVSGTYETSVSMGREVIVRPYKNTDQLNGVSTRDLIAIQKYILGTGSLESWYQLQAADANNDGKISPLDLVQLRKLILGLSESLSDSDSWRFYNVEDRKSIYRIAAMPDQMSADFIGVKVGDVNLDNDPSRDKVRTDRSTHWLLEDLTLAPDEHVILPVKASKAAGLEGFQFTFEFDTDALTDFEIVSGDKIKLNKGHQNLIRTSEGIITVSWYPEGANHIPVAEGDVLFYVSATAKRKVYLSDHVAISSKITEAELYDGNQTYGLALRFDGESDLIVYQNRPNPWKEQTAIGFDLPGTSEVQLTVYDVSGKIVKSEIAEYGRGYHEWHLEKTDFGAAGGVFYYKLESSFGTAIRKMVLMK